MHNFQEMKLFVAYRQCYFFVIAQKSNQKRLVANETHPPYFTG